MGGLIYVKIQYVNISIQRQLGGSEVDITQAFCLRVILRLPSLLMYRFHRLFHFSSDLLYNSLKFNFLFNLIACSRFVNTNIY